MPREDRLCILFLSSFTILETTTTRRTKVFESSVIEETESRHSLRHIRAYTVSPSEISVMGPRGFRRAYTCIFMKECVCVCVML